MTRPAVFLDRDGTIIEDAGYLADPAALRLFPWSAAAIRRFNDAGFAVVVVTNQAGVARGLFQEETIGAVHTALSAALSVAGATIDAYYYCPHHPEGVVDAYRISCGCRKPAPGLVRDAARDLALDVSRSWMVGDKWSDVACGAAAGTRTVLLRAGGGAAQQTSPADAAEVRADAILNNLMEAAEWILLNSSR
jgi:D-glycero-D-manno-heptose 1,7-bisphosphate phosphatase